MMICSLFLRLLFSSALFVSGASSPDVGSCHIRWLTPVQHDFGPVAQGTPVKVTFRFQNEGTTPVILETARTTCGCTAAEWTEKPILPGEEGSLTVEYDAYKKGKFRKRVNVFFDCQRSPFYLYITGKVKHKIFN